MPSPFDALQKSMMDVITRQFGYPAIWRRSSGDVSGQVLYKNPTKPQTLQDVEYLYDYPTIEYREGVFPGLFALAQNSQSNEYICVDGDWFHVRTAKKHFDGKTYIVLLEPTDVSNVPVYP